MIYLASVATFLPHSVTLNLPLDSEKLRGVDRRAPIGDQAKYLAH